MIDRDRFRSLRADEDTLFESRAGVHRMARQRHIQISSQYRQSARTAAVGAADAHAALAGDRHPVHRQGGRFERGQPQPAQDREGAGIDRVAAQLVARERRAVEQQHAHTAPRQDRRRHGPGRTGAANYDVVHASSPTPQLPTPD